MLNQLIGGSVASQHCWAEAVDFIAEEANGSQVYEWLLDTHGWPGEIFYYKTTGHIHISMPRPNIKIDQQVIAV